ncbi:TetR/AcrR family transcriptional regulator [Labrys sp. KNU-23]|uniref:TetR/AcrR family transcriptional regulator n=1 Tax=Labrys sp. KNU-23 TaxID=2789216 RepID=UPI0011EBFD6A|nr:TetR/AcrR family transcriptional regulator [Labrys sp. KNU-23]QEN87696.1 TetR/AcrR family transcriptional regulator [Labrys sp. KNU-23]
MAGRIEGPATPVRGERPRQRRIQPAEVRVDDLMSAAAELFIARGIEATTVDHIVARAGVAKGTFYHYFKTKTDVIHALRERFTQDFLSRVAAAIDACPREDHAARLSAWISGAVAAYLANFRLHDVVFHDFPHSQRQSHEKDAVIAQLVALLDEGRAAGAWAVPQCRTVALILFDGMHGVVDDAIAAGEHTPEPLCQLLTGLFSRMLAA